MFNNKSGIPLIDYVHLVRFTPFISVFREVHELIAKMASVKKFSIC